MYKRISSYLGAAAFLAASSAHAGIVTYNFGPDTGHFTSGASANTSGVILNDPLLLGGALQITTSSGSLYCVAGTGFPGTCAGAAGLSTSNAYGLGVGGGGANARVDGTETLTFTVMPGWNVLLRGFALTGFSGTEQAQYSINGGAATTVTPNGSVALDTYNVAPVQFNTLSFNAANGGNFSFARITVDATNVGIQAVPEPATAALIGFGLIGLGIVRRRKRV